MQNKGFIGTVAVLLILICGFYISFSFVTSHYEKKAEEYAARMSGTTDVTNDAYKSNLKQYNDSIDKEKVYLGYTYNQVRKMEIGMGLDLKGGMNVVLEISVPDILRQYAAGEPQLAQINAAIAKAEKEGVKSSEKGFIDRVAANFQPGAMAGLFSREGEFLGKIKSGSSNADVTDALKKQVDSQVDAAFNIFRTRIDQFGVVAPNIQKLQDKTGQILLELPGVKEPERVTELLKSSANLEFFEVYNYNEIAPELIAFSEAYAAADTINHTNLIELLGGRQREGSPVIGLVSPANQAMVDSILDSPLAKQKLPSDFSAVWEVKPVEIPVTDAKGNPIKKNDKEYRTTPYWQLIALKGEAALQGDVVTSASSEFDNMRGNTVNMRMNDRGAREWATLTRNNIGRPIAIVLDNRVYSYPNVNNEITGGSSEITGNFSPEEANDLANVLKSGKMSAQVKVVSNNVIGPSLGAEAIQQGFLSFIVAICLLMIFMIMIYGVIPGLVANIGLILNLYFTLGILASLQAVLTLSGIAGIVLALGMAVDANVLIFERTKEELRAGKNVRNALADGYSNAFSAIFDSNLTSIITGVILLVVGTGPIKGFATTLIIGLICSFFTAVYLSRLFFLWFSKTKAFNSLTFSTGLSKKMFVNAHINFLGQRKISFTVVAVMVVIVAISLFARGLNRGIDFSGGRNYIVKFERPVDTQELQQVLSAQFPDASTSVITIESSNQVRVSTNYKINSEEAGVENEITDKLFEALKPYLRDGMSAAEFSTTDASQGIVSSQLVGPSIANDMKTKAYLAVSISLLAMFLYILLRFRNVAFSLGALAAVAFTAFAIIGFYSLFYGILPFAMEVDQTFIAAILTVIGYQINDTVVVFDRVRENIGLYPKQDFYTTINNSINTTLSRTIMTSASTLLVLLCIFILGGDAIRSFTFAMLFGVIIGTLATIYVACPVAYLTDSRRKAVAAKKK